MLESAIKRLRPIEKRQLTAQSDSLVLFLGAKLDPSRYQPEETFSLDEILNEQS